MQERSVLAEKYVPQQYRNVNEVEATTVFPCEPVPTFDNQLNEIHSRIVPPVMQCRCKMRDGHFHGKQAPVRTIEPDIHFAVQHQKEQQRGSSSRRSSAVELPTVDNISDLSTYCSTFEELLREERTEYLLLFEKYSQYNHEITFQFEQRPEDKGAKLVGCISYIRGLSDAKPPVQPGDILLLRPLRLLSLPLPSMVPNRMNVYWSEATKVVEVFSQITDVVRNPQLGDMLQAMWLDLHWSNILRMAYANCNRYNLRIVPSPKMLVRCLTALDWLSTLPPAMAMDLLFPTKAPNIPILGKDIGIFEGSGLNEKQELFVRIVLSRTMKPEHQQIRGPMVLTGPAGTGKTRALLYAILQVLKLNEKSDKSTNGNTNGNRSVSRNRILVCTPSHTAANVVTRRLGEHLDPKRLFRLIDSDRPVATVPLPVLRYCRQNSMTGAFALPTPNELLQFEVIVCTCADAHLLYAAGMTNQQLRVRRQCFELNLKQTCAECHISLELKGINEPHFTHLFVDEAAQATEPESLIPLSVVVDPERDHRKVEIALVGDPRQLSPAVYSTSAATAGLGRSWMERLLQRPVSCLGGGSEHMLGPDLVQMEEWLRYCFQRDGQEQLSVFLTTNYRGHPSFLMLPSALFYSDKLRSAAYDRDGEDDSVEAFWSEKLRWVELLSEPVKMIQGLDANALLSELVPQKQYNWPVHFRGVIGKDVSVAIESGFASNSWANQEEADAVFHIVTSLTQNGVSTQSIGVMAPFRGQVALIRKLFREKDMGGVGVGVVEDFQAVERDVVVLSLTRSSQSFLSHDLDRRMGVFGHPKRSNVALTRAEHLLIVVGNPSVMSTDFVWRQFLWFSLRNGFWYGEEGGPEPVLQWTSTSRLLRHKPTNGQVSFLLSQTSQTKEDDENVVCIGTLERSLRS